MPGEKRPRDRRHEPGGRGQPQNACEDLSRGSHKRTWSGGWRGLPPRVTRQRGRQMLPAPPQDKEWCLWRLSARDQSGVF